MDFRLVRGDKSDRAQFCRKISWDFDTERGRLAFVARLIGLANETECRIIGAVDDKSRRSLFCASRSDLRNLSSQTLQHCRNLKKCRRQCPPPRVEVFAALSRLFHCLEVTHFLSAEVRLTPINKGRDVFLYL